MINNNVQCPHCLGEGKVMEAKKTKGFEYPNCKLCHGEGIVPQILADDYIFAN
jgi:DnaJ-class molecular chaperone